MVCSLAPFVNLTYSPVADMRAKQPRRTQRPRRTQDARATRSRPTDDQCGTACRLQKYLALCGLGSRRACEAIIDAGRVSVDGRKVAEQGLRIDPSTAIVKVDGKRVQPEKMIWILLNKPRDVVTTCSDPQERRTFNDIIPDFGSRLYPAGRLDRDSEGALLLTNDGALTQSVTHPSRHAEKIYEVWTTAEINAQQIAQMCSGMRSEGETLRAISVSRTAKCKYSVVLGEGKKRQIRRMFAGFGSKVTRLKRTSIGSLRLGKLRSGEWRFLTEKEVIALRQCAIKQA